MPEQREVCGCCGHPVDSAEFLRHHPNRNQAIPWSADPENVANWVYDPSLSRYRRPTDPELTAILTGQDRHLPDPWGTRHRAP